MATPLAGAWLFFSIAGCAASLRRGYPRQSLLSQFLGVWLILLGVSCFLLRPVSGGAATMWILAVAPMMALTMHPRDIEKSLYGFGIVLIIFCLGLLIQWGWDVKYTNGWDGAKSWPMMDPNNAAAVIAAGAVFTFALSFQDKKFLFLLGLFLAGLAITLCKAGIMAVAIACLFIVSVQHGRKWLWVLSFGLLSPLFPSLWHKILYSLGSRKDIWAASLPLARENPLSGLGLGSFSHYYALVRTELDTMGSFAHNDVFQFAIEMGWPIALFFCLVVFTTLWTMRYIPSAAAYVLCLFLMSMVEFQFYVPAVSILFGLALACCCAGVTSMQDFPRKSASTASYKRAKASLRR